MIYKFYSTYLWLRISRFLLPLILGGSIQTYAQNAPKFNRITSLDGLSHNTVYTIAQDTEGFMWFGTREGLNRYDGENLITYYTDDKDSLSLLNNQVRALGIGTEGRLFVGTNIGLCVFDQEQNHFREIRFNEGSLGNINKIFTSSDSSIYICTWRGLFVKHPQSNLQWIIRGTPILDLIEFKTGVFWAASNNKILLINSYGETIKEFSSIRKSDEELIDLASNTNCLFKDSDGNIWLGTRRNGLFKYDESSELFRSILSNHPYNPLEVNVVRSISEDHLGNLWIGTESGLIIYDERKEDLQVYNQSFDKSSGQLSDKAIYAIYQSKENIMWVGTYFGGINMARPWENGFYSLLPDGGNASLSGKAVSQIIKSKTGKFWIGTEDGGINIWDKSNGNLSYHRHDSRRNSLTVDNVHSLYEDNDGTIWIGTFLGGVNKFNPKQNTFNVFKDYGPKNTRLTNNMVYAIQRDHREDLWIGTQAGLSKFSYVKNAYEPYMPDIFWNKFVFELLEDKEGGLWVCINNQDSIFYLDADREVVEKYGYSKINRIEINNTGTISALEDSQGRLWFGTINDGLLQFIEEEKDFRNYTVTDGLANNYVYGILEDDHNNLWLSTNKGLSKFDIDKKTFKNYDISHGLPQNQFNFNSAYKDEDGWMYFGTIYGLCYFHPDSIAINNLPPKIYLSDFKLFNKSVPVDENSILTQSINSTDQIILKHSMNVLTFEFGAINYFNSGNKNTYAYYLDGFETEWNYVDNKRSATYTNISPGEYTFRVKASNNDGVWSDNVKEVNIVVLPPVWKTSWAYTLYLLLFIGLILLTRRIIIFRNEGKMAAQIARIEKEKIEEINRHKINFFTYISHEFKTPLTLILASIDNFINAGKIDETLDKTINSISRNAKRLHFLVSQLMEFRKIESDHAQINHKRGDIIVFLEDTFNAFGALFTEKGIEYKFTSNIKHHIAYFDSDKLEKIITNLISNAAKYTSENGMIEMEAQIQINDEGKEDLLNIIISDTGTGIEQKELDRIFAPFYQTDKSNVVAEGTGIGLALVKSLVNFMGGSIEVKSDLHRGTFITFAIPLIKELKGKILSVDGNKKLIIEQQLFLESDETGDEIENQSIKDNFEVMLVEDNLEILNMLREHFSQKYQVNKARNGKEALSKMEKRLPDIVISDIMMPEMDGLELCKNIKSDIKTSHIPVVLLTAKDSPEQRIEGLDVGADLYISKPFNQLELDLRIRNILESRSNLKNHFLKFGNVSDIDIPITNKDQDFLQSLREIVEKHIEDSNFNITTFTQEAGVSRSLLHMKLRKLVNLSASEFVKTIRLQRACEFLENTDFSISEIAYKVGYSDPGYFARSFKERYNQNPKDFRNQALDPKDN